MNIDDRAQAALDPADPQVLMAYADGELAAADAARVEAAIAVDPALARIVDDHRALRARLSDAFAGVLAEPVPARLHAALRTGARATASPPMPSTASRPRWRRREWLAMAASLLAGVALALAVPQFNHRPRDAGLAAAMVDANLVARGALARALDAQLSGQAVAGVQPGLSFRALDGRYCRTFKLQSPRALAGLACRDGAAWRVSTLAAVARVEAAPMRQAGSALPPAVLADIDARIDGPSLDVQAERQARAQGWR
jgi:hypothetical protein